MSELTQEKVLAMVGRELDSLVAEKVMGLELHDDHKTLYRIDGERSWGAPLWYELPKYSTDISEAMEVADKFDFLYLYRHKSVTKGKYECKVAYDDRRELYAYGDTAPEAICKAALLAMEGKGERTK